MIRLGINGFGRIGRCVFRVCLERSDVSVVAINDVADREALAYLLRYDTVMGRLSVPVELRGDGQQVVQVLTNILQNAAESIDGRDAPLDGELAPGRIVVSVAANTERIAIEIEDNGRGLPGDLRDRLVEPYVTTRAKGTGLGLAIVKKIMEDHNGELVLDDARKLAIA